MRSRDHLREGLDLFERNERLGAFDAVLAAAAAQSGASALVSTDAGFEDLAEISHVVPDAPDVVELLGK